jgi:hypothetical protein
MRDIKSPLRRHGCQLAIVTAARSKRRMRTMWHQTETSQEPPAQTRLPACHSLSGAIAASEACDEASDGTITHPQKVPHHNHIRTERIRITPSVTPADRIRSGSAMRLRIRHEPNDAVVTTPLSAQRMTSRCTSHILRMIYGIRNFCEPNKCCKCTKCR